MNFIEIAIEASLLAGKAILKIYNSHHFEIEKKEDESPLTKADKEAHKIIEKTLSKTNLPILSEEGEKYPYESRKNWGKFWIVDPLDGTKEFINRNGEFTVNIAIIENQEPILGVIYVPTKQELFYTHKNKTFKINGISELSHFKDIHKPSNMLTGNKEYVGLKIIASRSFLNEATLAFVNEIKRKNKGVDIVCIGSSLKFCLLAEGKADIYPRMGPTMEWDTAAGEVIARFSGFKTKKAYSDESLKYNKKDLRNPNFIVEREY